MKLLVVFRFAPRTEKVKFSITEQFFFLSFFLPFFLSFLIYLFIYLFIHSFIHLFIYLFSYLVNILRCTSKSDLN